MNLSDLVCWEDGDNIVSYGDDSYSTPDIMIGVRLEHVRLPLRVMCIGAFNIQDPDSLVSSVQEIEARVERLLYSL